MIPYHAALQATPHAGWFFLKKGNFFKFPTSDPQKQKALRHLHKSTRSRGCFWTRSIQVHSKPSVSSLRHEKTGNPIGLDQTRSAALHYRANHRSSADQARNCAKCSALGNDNGGVGSLSPNTSFACFFDPSPLLFHKMNHQQYHQHRADCRNGQKGSLFKNAPDLSPLQRRHRRPDSVFIIPYFNAVVKNLRKFGYSFKLKIFHKPIAISASLWYNCDRVASFQFENRREKWFF